jgi:hypothetical protein
MNRNRPIFHEHNPKSIIFQHTHINEKNLKINNLITSNINQSFYLYIFFKIMHMRIRIFNLNLCLCNIILFSKVILVIIQKICIVIES